MERSYSLSLPDGYQIFEKEEELKIWQAEEILVTDKIKKYIRAVREGDKATLLAHYLRCPHCGKTIPANSFSPLLALYSSLLHISQSKYSVKIQLLQSLHGVLMIGSF